MADTAKVFARIKRGGKFLKRWNGESFEYIQADIECSTDLPADALGEVAAQAINMAWKTGEDPVKFEVVLTFQ